MAYSSKSAKITKAERNQDLKWKFEKIDDGPLKNPTPESRLTAKKAIKYKNPLKDDQGEKELIKKLLKTPQMKRFKSEDPFVDYKVESEVTPKSEKMFEYDYDEDGLVRDSGGEVATKDDISNSIGKLPLFFLLLLTVMLILYRRTMGGDRRIKPRIMGL